MTNAKGMTLIEILIVLAIVGIVGVIASLNWKRFVSNADLRSFARAITTDIAKIKQQAVSKGLCHRITFNASNSNYVIERGNSDCSAYTIVETKSPSSLGLSSGVQIIDITYPDDNIEFQARGICSFGTVRLENDRESRALITSTITGKTYVEYNM